MRTYDGILIDKDDKDCCRVYADNKEVLEIFADEHGFLREEWKKEFRMDLLADGLYQAEVGYGPYNSMQDPSIYWVKRISKVLDWSGRGAEGYEYKESVE